MKKIFAFLLLLPIISFIAKGLVHFWLPRSNERMLIVTGFVYNPIELYIDPYVCRLLF